MTAPEEDMLTTTNNAILLLPHSPSSLIFLQFFLFLCAPHCMGQIFFLCIIFLHPPIPMWNCLAYQNHGLIELFLGKSNTFFFVVKHHPHPSSYSVTFCDFRSDFKKFATSFHSRRHPLPTQFNIYSFPLPTLFPSRCAESMERMCC